MRCFWLFSFLCLSTASVVNKTATRETISTEDAIKFLKEENTKLAEQLNKITLASWAHESDITDENEKALQKATSEYDQFKKDQSQRAAKKDYSKLNDLLKRQFEKMIVIGTSALDEQDGNKFQKSLLKMVTTYSTAKVNVGHKTNLELEPDLTQMFATSTNPDELRDAWTKWRDATGKQMRQDYIDYFTLGNKAAKLNKLVDKEFNTFDDLWMFVWESTDIKKQVTDLMEELKPFYQKIHAYVRYHLQKKYPNHIPNDGTIPAHLLGNMWAQDWGNLLQTIPEMNPYPEVDPIDEQVNDKLKEWDVEKMFHTADTFFQSLGMDKMTDSFWENSILKKQQNKKMVCHASAWDFYKIDDFRIKQCTDKTLSDLQTVHHEMGHIQYFMQYQNQPAVYRDGANPGFHEAIGDLIALSVVTPNHLHEIGLFDKTTDDNVQKINLNYQMKMALEKVAFLPFSFVIDKFRWDIFSNPDKMTSIMNKHWWKLRLDYQGISSPVTRSEEDFDAGAKYHVPASVEYVRYFVSHILQFQFFETMCKIVDPTITNDRLYTCDFNGNQEAGSKLIELLKAGSSDSWENILEKFIGSKKMSLSSLMNYFTPLIKYLDDFIAKNNIELGWKSNVQDYVNENILFLNDANNQYREWSNKIGLASWDQSSNINDENNAKLKNITAEYNKWRKELGEKAKTYNFGKNIRERRQFEKFAVYGTSALSEEDGSKFNDAGLRMKTIYSEASIIINGTKMELEPDLVDLLATSTNDNLLKEAWIKWRDATGRKMRNDYIEFFKLGNKAATMNSVEGKEFKTFDDLWMFEWESSDLKEQIDKLMNDLEPFYKKIHAYVRYHLSKIYKLPDDGTIPAHLVGNMWSQQWGNLLNLIPQMNPSNKDNDNDNQESIDSIVNENLNKKTVKEMFELSEKFFNDLSMEKMTNKFWQRSILIKPNDRNLTCHASAWDLFDAEEDDFRIKQCTEKTMNDLVTVHHEMGHVQYYMNYKVQEPIYRRGANPGFHEAIGDLIALSVSTPNHLQDVGLYKPPNGINIADINLNYQMKMALDKIAFLPFSYVMDKWRWDVFGNSDIQQNMNRRWWELRLQKQGISPPVKRSEQDFDPGAKYHIPANVEYVRYFVSHVLQFQFFDKMCSYVRPNFTSSDLYTCDFDGNQKAGEALKSMLTYGSSDNWQNILEKFTGQRNMSLNSLNKYFGPLQEYLDKYILDKNITIGWNVNINDYFETLNSSSVSSLSTSFITMVIVSIISIIISASSM